MLLYSKARFCVSRKDSSKPIAENIPKYLVLVQISGKVLRNMVASQLHEFLDETDYLDPA